MRIIQAIAGGVVLAVFALGVNADYTIDKGLIRLLLLSADKIIDF